MRERRINSSKFRVQSSEFKEKSLKFKVELILQRHPELVSGSHDNEITVSNSRLQVESGMTGATVQKSEGFAWSETLIYRVKHRRNIRDNRCANSETLIYRVKPERIQSASLGAKPSLEQKYLLELIQVITRVII